MYDNQVLNGFLRVTDKCRCRCKEKAEGGGREKSGAEFPKRIPKPLPICRFHIIVSVLESVARNFKSHKKICCVGDVLSGSKTRLLCNCFNRFTGGTQTS